MMVVCWAKRCVRAENSARIERSRPVVGSSRMRSFGSVMSARAMRTRFFWPYERWPNSWSARSSMWSRPRAERARGRPLCFLEIVSVMYFFTTSLAGEVGSWKIPIEPNRPDITTSITGVS